MNSSTADIISKIKKIETLENTYGSSAFCYGLDSDDEVVDMYKLILQLMDSCQTLTADRLSTSDEAKLLLDMLSCGLLSPGAAALILIDNYPDYNVTRCLIENHLKSVSAMDHAIFASVYYSKRHDILEKLSTKMISDLGLDLGSAVHSMKSYLQEYKMLTEGSSVYFKGSCAVYTAITGGYDRLNDPEFLNPDWDYYCFTDHPENYSSDIWQFKSLEIASSPVLMSRYAKMHPHVLLKDYDFTVYIDGKLTITGDMTEYMNVFSKGRSMLCFPHPLRHTIKEELEALITYGKGDPEILRKQLMAYSGEGFNNQRPLTDTACLIRSNKDPLLIKTMDDWWNELSKYSLRDQMSLGYVSWKNNYLYDISALNIYKNPFLRKQEHLL